LSGDSKSWPPALSNEAVAQIGAHELSAWKRRNDGNAAQAKMVCNCVALIDAVLGNVDVGFLEEDFAGGAVLNAVKKVPGNPEGVGNNACCHSRMTWDGKVLDRENTKNNTAERGADPGCGIVLRFGIKNAYKIDVANGGAEFFEIAFDFGTAAFFTGFKKNGDLGMVEVVLLKIAESSDNKKTVVAIVVGAASIDFVSADDGIGGTKTFAPARWIKMWHLVKMTIAKNMTLTTVEGWNVNFKKRLMIGFFENSGSKTLDVLALHPSFCDFNCLMNKAVG